MKLFLQCNKTEAKNMAAELMGGALLSASLQVLFEKIASPEVVDYLPGMKNSGFDSLLEKLKIKLSSVTAVLNDAEDVLAEIENVLC